MNKWGILLESASGNSHFSATVVNVSNGEPICECVFVDQAIRIAKALNAWDEKGKK